MLRHLDTASFIIGNATLFTTKPAVTQLEQDFHNFSAISVGVKSVTFNKFHNWS